MQPEYIRMQPEYFFFFLINIQNAYLTKVLDPHLIKESDITSRKPKTQWFLKMHRWSVTLENEKNEWRKKTRQL